MVVCLLFLSHAPIIQSSQSRTKSPVDLQINDTNCASRCRCFLNPKSCCSNPGRHPDKSTRKNHNVCGLIPMGIPLNHPYDPIKNPVKVPLNPSTSHEKSPFEIQVNHHFYPIICCKKSHERHQMGCLNVWSYPKWSFQLGRMMGKHETFGVLNLNTNP